MSCATELDDRRPEVQVLSEKELAQRPEVKSINRFIILRTCFRIALKGVGALALLWATVVLLGGFVSSLSKAHFWLVTGIAFFQATGVFDAFGGAMFMFLRKWIISLVRLSSKLYVLYFILFQVLNLAPAAPIICVFLSYAALKIYPHPSADGNTSEGNLEPALKLYYCVSLCHSLICYFVSPIEVVVDILLLKYVCQRLCLSHQVVFGYLEQTKMMCLSNMVSVQSWNMITYGTSLLDSQLPQDYAAGARVVTILIDHGVPVRQVLIRSPGSRIRKLIGALVLTSPVDGEKRWLAARIVEHIACDLSLAQFPGALECVSSLLDTSSHSSAADHEAIQLQTGHGKAPTKITFLVLLRKTKEMLSKNRKLQASRIAVSNEIESTVITNGDLILQGLRILEILAHDQHNCAMIHSTKDLISKIVAPVCSNSLTQDIDTNAAWIQVVDASLRVVIRLMRAAGDTGKELRCLIADSSNAIGNLEAILSANGNNSCILELQMRAMDIFAELFSHGSTASWVWERSKNIIENMLDIFSSVEWMENYLAQEKRIKIDENQMKEAIEIVSLVKEKAGEALAAMISMGNSKAIIQTNRSFEDVIHSLTEMLDSKTIQCKISATETMEVKMKIGCRISAAVILKHLCPLLTMEDSEYVQETTLNKVLVELLQEQESSTGSLRSREHRIDIRDEYYKHAEKRKLQASLLSLYSAICARYNIKASHFVTRVSQHFSQEDLVRKLEKMVDENIRATPACLAILKLTCKMVEELIPDDHPLQDIDMKKKIINTLSQVVDKISKASKTMAGLENAMLFAGTYADLYGVPVKPPLSVLVKQVEVLVEQRKLDLGFL